MDDVRVVASPFWTNSFKVLRGPGHSTDYAVRAGPFHSEQNCWLWTKNESPGAICMSMSQPIYTDTHGYYVAWRDIYLIKSIAIRGGYQGVRRTPSETSTVIYLRGGPEYDRKHSL